MADRPLAELKDSLSSAYTAYLSQLKLAGPVWETKPAAGEGEDAWSARQVAEHVASANLFFANNIAGAIKVDAPQMQRFQFATNQEAIAATESAQVAASSVIGSIKDEQAGIEIELPIGKHSVGGILGIVAYHLTDHANQLKTLCG